jgi:hypothetical protein
MLAKTANIMDHETRTTVVVDAVGKKDLAFEKRLDVTEMGGPAAGVRNNNDNETLDAEKAASGAGEDAPAGTGAADPNLVNWDGPDDPENPRNWSKTHKLAIVILVSMSVLYCNLATIMFAPGANIMQAEFGFKSDTINVLTITIASLGFAVGQLFVPPLSEVFGRLPIYRASGIFYLGFTAGCARSTNVAEFLVFRLCTGLAAASYMTTGGGTVADLLPKEERGLAMAIFTTGPLFGPVYCPLSILKYQMS